MNAFKGKKVTLGSVFVNRKIKRDEELGVWVEGIEHAIEPITIPLEECMRYFDLHNVREVESCHQDGKDMLTVLPDFNYDYYVIPGEKWLAARQLLDFEASDNKETLDLYGNLDAIYGRLNDKAMQRCAVELKQKQTLRRAELAQERAARIKQAEKLSSLAATFGIQASAEKIVDTQDQVKNRLKRLMKF